MNAFVKAELENLQIQFGNKSTLTLDDYAALYEIDRRYASKHLKRRGIPIIKEGKGVYITITDLAAYKAERKHGSAAIEEPRQAPDMKSRRGFNQMAAQRKGARA